MSDSEFDVIVVGAGHNSLGAAAYLQRCGLKTLVLEKNAVPGGGAISESLGMEGYVHDTHATGVVHLQGHPILTADELELKSKFGLRFIHPEISFMSVFGDGTTLACYADLDRTCADIARYSAKDAAAYREMVQFMSGIMPMINMSMARPPLPFAGFLGMLGNMPGGNDLLLMFLKSAQDIVVERFEHPKVQLHLLKWVAEGLTCSPEQKTTGIAMLYLIGLSHEAPPGVPEGGMLSLSLSMIRCIEHYGGEIRLGVKVKRIINSGGVARSVELDSGEVLTARRAVVATIHPHLLGDMVDGLDPALVAKAGAVQLSDFGGLRINCALREKPIWKAGQQPDDCLYINLMDDTELMSFREYMEAMKLGRLNERPIACVSCHTNFDPTRAPEGRHTLYVFALAPGKLADGGIEGWDGIKEERADRIIEWLGGYISNLTPENIIARHVDSPLDMMRHSPSFQNGDLNGIAMFLYQMMGARPIPELSQYRVPGAEGLYLTGPTMHPGGGMTGGGRPVAIRIMEDLKVDYSAVIRS
ncbi:NAD(P)/FAD-dependent oxidoreductase [Sphingobium sp.]|uniref:phytoene desaturase family protein n=1 Tax=Sphingobium sp. TaxID=1912891 RepID=UPI0028BEF7B5|nr:NAD(P)/FAD-dependent oxidoreductase [Sphingobium sp.]